jgi:anti-anti-sigma factor
VQDQFRVQVRSEDRATIVAVKGELDLASSPALEQELERVNRSDTEVVILDLSELEFMDSTGLSVVVRANQRAQDSGKRFGVLKGSPQVQRLLSLTGVDERITVADSLDQLLG